MGSSSSRNNGTASARPSQWPSARVAMTETSDHTSSTEKTVTAPFLSIRPRSKRHICMTTFTAASHQRLVGSLPGISETHLSPFAHERLQTELEQLTTQRRVDVAR